MKTYDKWLLDGAERHLAGDPYQPPKVKDIGIKAEDKQSIYKWAKKSYDEYHPSELEGVVDWTGEVIQRDDLCSYLDVEGWYVPNFRNEVVEAVIEFYGIEGE